MGAAAFLGRQLLTKEMEGAGAKELGNLKGGKGSDSLDVTKSIFEKFSSVADKVGDIVEDTVTHSDSNKGHHTVETQKTSSDQKTNYADQLTSGAIESIKKMRKIAPAA